MRETHIRPPGLPAPPSRRLLSAATILLLLLAGGQGSLAQEAPFVLSPDPPRFNGQERQTFEVPLDPGVTFEDAILVANRTDRTLRLRVYPVDADVRDDGTVDAEPGDTEPVGLGRWISVARSSLELPPHETETVEFRVRIGAEPPAPALAAIVVEEEPDEEAETPPARDSVLLRPAPAGTATAAVPVSQPDPERPRPLVIIAAVLVVLSLALQLMLQRTRPAPVAEPRIAPEPPVVPTSLRSVRPATDAASSQPAPAGPRAVSSPPEPTDPGTVSGPPTDPPEIVSSTEDTHAAHRVPMPGRSTEEPPTPAPSVEEPSPVDGPAQPPAPDPAPGRAPASRGAARRTAARKPAGTRRSKATSKKTSRRGTRNYIPLDEL